MVTNFGKSHGGLNDLMTCVLNLEVADVFLGCHVETGFEFTLERAKGKMGNFSQLGDGNVVAEGLVHTLEGCP